MAETSPFPEKPLHQAPGSKHPANHKRLIVVLIIVAVLGIVALFFTMYSSSRNSGDGTADRQAQPVPGTKQQASSAALKNQTQPSEQTVSEVGQETTLKLYANSGNELVNTVQTVVTYPGDSLQLVSVAASTAFPNEAATDTTKAGVIRLVRAVSSQAASVKGEQVVATITFKKLKTVDAAAVVSVDKSQSYLVTSSDNRNLIGTSSASLTVR